MTGAGPATPRLSILACCWTGEPQSCPQVAEGAACGHPASNGRRPVATHITPEQDAGQHVMRPDCPCRPVVGEDGVIRHAPMSPAPVAAAPEPDSLPYGVTRLT